MVMIRCMRPNVVLSLNHSYSKPDERPQGRALHHYYTVLLVGFINTSLLSRKSSDIQFHEVKHEFIFLVSD